FLLIGIILVWRKAWIPIDRNGLWRMTLIGALMGIHWVAFYASIKVSNASIALICLATSSTFISFLEPLMNRSRWNPRETWLSLVAVLGVIIIYKAQPHFGIGLFLGLLAAVVAALFTILN